MGLCHYTFVQNIEYATPRANPKVNYGLRVIAMCQRRFILGKQCTILMSCDDDEGGHTCVGAEGTWAISAASSLFYRKPKTALNKSNFKRVFADGEQFLKPMTSPR